MWVGKKFYTHESFKEEARVLGISKRISTVPKGLVLGKTWVLLAHPEAGINEKGEKAPAVFQAFRPDRVEKVLTEDMATEEEREALEKRGITPVVVEDHQRHYDGELFE